MARDVAVERKADRDPEVSRIEALLLHDWRMEQLARLGVPLQLADVYADAVDWHELERLIGRGCDPVTALDILR